MPVVTQCLDERLQLQPHPVDRGTEAPDFVRKVIESLSCEVAFADRLCRPRDAAETNGDQRRDDKAGYRTDGDGKNGGLEKLVVDEPQVHGELIGRCVRNKRGSRITVHRQPDHERRCLFPIPLDVAVAASAVLRARLYEGTLERGSRRRLRR